MVDASRPIDRPPFIVRAIDPIARRLLARGLPMGPNTLITVRGRRSGAPRSAAVALLEIDGRWWVISAYGETHWVRNLRAAGEAVLRVDGRDEAVRAVELSPECAAAFFRNTLAPYLARRSFPMRLAGRLFTGDALTDPDAAARRRPVFALLPADAGGAPVVSVRDD